METRAQLNSIRLAPRKVRAVAGILRKLDVLEALDQLEHTIRRPAPVFIKLIKSAIANAENNSQMVADNLYIKNVVVNEGIKLKRFMPRAQGRATEIQKKTSRIMIILDERVPGMKQHKTVQKSNILTEKKEVELPIESTESIQPKPSKSSKIERELGKKKGFFAPMLRKIFQRKSV